MFLQAALETLRDSGPSLGGAHRASDATIAALMRALRLREDPSAWGEYLGGGSSAPEEEGRLRALGALRDSGVKLERKVADYLTGGMRLRGKMYDNANDVLADSERRGVRGRRGEEELRQGRSSSVGAIRLEGFEGGQARPAGRETKALYDAFEQMLALRGESPPRQPRAPSEPLPKRDTKRAVPLEHLRNAPKRRL